jgi:hypothetical protein
MSAPPPIPQAEANPAISAEVLRLARQHPETANWLWIVVIVFNFLLVIPVVFGALHICFLYKVNGALGLVFGMAAWLGLFMFLRQCMFWRRQSKVSAFLNEFNAAFPVSPTRDTALACLRAIKDDENEVLVVVKEKLGTRSVMRKPGVLSLSNPFQRQAAVGQGEVGDPRIDGMVGDLLARLNARLLTLSWIQWIVGLGVPLAFFVLAGIEDPKTKAGDLIWGTLVILVVWNLIFAFIMGLVEAPFLGKAARQFGDWFPEGGPDRAVALAAFMRVNGCGLAKTQLRRWLSMNANDEDEEDEEDGDEEDAAPRRRGRRPARNQENQSPPASAAVWAPPPPQAPPPSGQLLLEPFVAATPPVALPSVPHLPPESRSVALLESAAQPVRAAPVAPAAPSRFCTQCGQPLDSGLKFCPQCGVKLR